MQVTNIHQNITKADFLKAINREDFVEPQKGDGEYAVSLQISEEAQKRFEADIVPLEREALDLPEYCGIYKTDKAIASAVENCSKEERIFVYKTIRLNFLNEDTASLTEEERQANIALGMKKAEYAAENFIPEKEKQKFLNAMGTIAKIASAGTADRNGKMNYGITKSTYLGHGSNLVETTNTLDVMKNMDSAAYNEYLRIGEESSDEDRDMNQTKFLTKWYIDSVKKKPGIMKEYEKINARYLEKVKNKELSHHFDNIDVSDKGTFLAGLRDFMSKNQKFMSGVLSLELSDRFWKS